MNGWQLVDNIFLVLGIIGVAIGLLLRFEAGRRVLRLLAVALVIFSLIVEGSDEWTKLIPDTAPLKASHFLLIAGSCCLCVALFIARLHPLLN
jgi:hypothetical protein